MADELLLEIVTPEKMAFNGKVEEVTVPGSEGEFGVLRGHASLLSSIQIGELSYTQNNKKVAYAVDTGYAEVLASKVTILVEGAERSDMIDRDQARKDKEEAEAKLAKMAKEDADYERVKSKGRRSCFSGLFFLPQSTWAMKISTISNSRTPPGAFTRAVSPMVFPTRALPKGEVTDILFLPISDSWGPTNW